MANNHTGSCYLSQGSVRQRSTRQGLGCGHWTTDWPLRYGQKTKNDCSGLILYLNVAS